MKHHPAGRRQTINKQAVAAVILKSLRDTQGCGRGGASPSQCVSARVCVCVRAPQRKKSTEGSCTCAAWRSSLDSALRITSQPPCGC